MDDLDYNREKRYPSEKNKWVVGISNKICRRGRKLKTIYEIFEDNSTSDAYKTIINIDVQSTCDSDFGATIIYF